MCSEVTSPSEQESLSRVRETIDRIDREIQSLLNERAEAAQEVARVKLASDPDAVFYRPEREAQVLRGVMERNSGPLADNTMAFLFREIMSACLALEKPMNVAFLGPEGTFTQEAAQKHFGHAVRTQPLGAIDEVFREVESGGCSYGVVPIENSTEGAVNHTLDMFLRSPLKICGEVELRIHHNLLTQAGDQDLSEIEVVYSHRQSLAQCREWLDRHLPNARRIEVSSNAEAARIVSGPHEAAIAGTVAAGLYDLQVRYENIEDQPDNTTRFLVISKESVPASGGQDRTSLLVSAANRSGALYGLLKPFADRSISLTRIESRPARSQNWEYVFFIDLDGHGDEPRVAEALEQLRADAAMVKVLGSYPRAVIV